MLRPDLPEREGNSKKARVKADASRKRAHAEEESLEYKKGNTCSTDCIDELTNLLFAFSLEANRPTLPRTPENVLGMYYQKMAQAGLLGTLKKIDLAVTQRGATTLEAIDKHKGWALGMAVLENNEDVVKYILANPGKELLSGHINYAIQKAEESHQQKILSLLLEFKATQRSTHLHP